MYLRLIARFLGNLKWHLFNDSVAIPKKNVAQEGKRED